jgi:hypothetical protein
MVNRPQGTLHGTSTETVVRPRTIADLRKILKDWITEILDLKLAEPDSATLSKSGEVLLLEFKLPERSNTGIELQKDMLAWWSGKRRLAVHLGDFCVKTGLRKSHAWLELTPRVQAAYRPLETTVESIRETKHPAFFTRALKAVAELDRELPKEVLDEAISESNNYLVLLYALSSPTAVQEAVEVDPLAEARLRGIERQISLLKAAGGAYSSGKVAEILNISRQAVDKRRREGKLLGLTQERRGYAYPAWQFEDPATLKHLESILKLLQEHDPWMQMAFFFNKNTRLREMTPVEALKLGEIQAVREAAASYGEHGAA